MQHKMQHKKAGILCPLSFFCYLHIAQNIFVNFVDFAYLQYPDIVILYKQR